MSMKTDETQMAIDANPYRSLSANITPDDFEPFCLETLKACAEEEGLSNFDIKHNQQVEAYGVFYVPEAV